jgi:hypothetical protein
MAQDAGEPRLSTLSKSKAEALGVDRYTAQRLNNFDDSSGAGPMMVTSERDVSMDLAVDELVACSRRRGVCGKPPQPDGDTLTVEYLDYCKSINACADIERWLLANALHGRLFFLVVRVRNEGHVQQKHKETKKHRSRI